MSPQAIETFSTVGVGVLSITVGIMALALFFNVLGWLNDASAGIRGEKPKAMAIRGILRKDTWVTVHTTGQENFERVRVIGFTDTQSAKTSLPFDLQGMIVLEDPEGKRFLIRTKAIRMIVIAPDAKRDQAKARA